MFLNPGGMGGTSWNNSRPDDEGYSMELWGTVVSLQEVQARMYNPNSKQPGAPRFWPDGNPVMNIRMGLATPDGSLKSVTFAKAGKKQATGEKPSLHMQLFALTNHNMMDLIGKTIHLWTWPANPQTGVTWGQGNPRLFGVEEVEGTTYQLAGQLPSEFLVPELLCNDGAQGGQPMPPNMIQQPQVPPMQGNFYAPPTIPQYAQHQPPSPQEAYMQGYQAAQQQPAQYQSQPIPQQNMQPMGMQPPMQQQPMPQQAAPAPQAMAPQGMGAPAPMPATQAMPPQPASAPMPQGMDPAVAAAMQAVGAVNVQEVDSTGGVYDDDIPFNNYR